MANSVVMGISAERLEEERRRLMDDGAVIEAVEPYESMGETYYRILITRKDRNGFSY